MNEQNPNSMMTDAMNPSSHQPLLTHFNVNTNFSHDSIRVI